ncbi:5-methyltetrahydropteroyltriglutamate--homocysteine S-methyltransferase [Paenibacillus taichungensis]|uniref:5-methyltetrahydropteroyltriglutamate-- homocysteine S-methyltransferase n=1 Tax=Paenibacillus taichungensis TaxID=484184 RepID=UPI003D9AB372
MSQSQQQQPQVLTANLGYPRIGAGREWKKALESFWAGRNDESTLHQELTTLRLQDLKKQQAQQLDLIPVGDFSYYDHILDVSAMFGVVPERFNHSGGPVSVSTYFAMARGNDQATACEMTKWLNTNYHYIVPEIHNDTAFALLENKPLAAYREAKQELGLEGKPVVVGPYSYVRFAKGYDAERFAEIVTRLVPVYAQLLSELQAEGVQWVQIDEPALTLAVSSEDEALLQQVYAALAQAAPELKLLLQTYFESVEAYPVVTALPVAGIGLDLVHGYEGNFASLREHGFPQDKWLGAGVIDGRNIWRADLAETAKLLEQVAEFAAEGKLIIQPSCSLLHVPVTAAQESALDPVLRNALAFADEKLEEIATLGTLLSGGAKQADQAAALAEASRRAQASTEAVRLLSESESRTRLSGAPAGVHADEQLLRDASFQERRELQQQKWSLPLLPTTTIGSFPQTADVRKARALFRKGEWNAEQYDAYVREQIQEWITIQEEIGLDVLVHGEFERTDMVEFFGEKLTGFAFTKNGWVQSYGSRCVKPPVIYGDVLFNEPMTVKETAYAQTLTSKPVKGMLTGPVTILNWSFVRSDIPRSEVSYQIARAIRDEVEALEQAGIEMIQVDEPALREGLPLKRSKWDEYLRWAVESFRLATATVKPTTQVHTHMCYCEFDDIIEAISDLDADVISIETSRSHGELVGSFEQNTYDKGIGLGVYDIHSPRVPGKDEMLNMIERALQVLPADLFWVNPDCGLKTRGKAEVVDALSIMVDAARTARERVTADSSI